MISVVVPIYNEEENLPQLRSRISSALEATKEDWELILVNDGSKDLSGTLIRGMHAEDARIKGVFLSRNFGHQPAVTAGIHHASGDCVILVDGDLQDPPELIPQMVERWKDGAQVVIAERNSRVEGGVRGIGFRIFYPLFRRVSGIHAAPDAGIYGLMDRRVVDEFNKLPERSRFIPGLRTWLGFRQETVLYDRQDRAAGEAKQTLGRLFRYATDAMISFSNKPLRIATWMGFIVAAIGFAVALFFVYRRLFQKDDAVTGFTTLLCMMMFLGGIQLIAVGVLGEYIARMYEELKQRPLYVVQETVGETRKT